MTAARRLRDWQETAICISLIPILDGLAGALRED
jgi:hypothetical protein